VYQLHPCFRSATAIPLRLVGIPSYGVQGMFFDIEDGNQQHGPNERVGVREFYDGIEFTNHLMHILTHDSSTTPRSGPDPIR
jgi:acetylornithine deacetylase/succinyl-diaminopimelate desuccinylase-like protein